MVICAAYSTTGLDKLSSDYFTQGIGMAKKMGLLGPLSYLKKPLRRKVYNMTAWALYGYQGLLAFHIRPRSNLERFFISPDHVVLPAHLKSTCSTTTSCSPSTTPPPTPTGAVLTVAYRDIRNHSCNFLNLLLRLYYLRHGFETWKDSLTTWLHYATLNPRAQAVDGPGDQGHSLYIARVFFNILRNEMPEDVREILDRHVTDQDDETSNNSNTGPRAHHLHATWPCRRLL
ncbi:hypothetical protein HYQ45_017136 [Verticillium longisporum]|uniref:Uncharacterized protein n=1 Tax=Verticillium longisporum TaxID=100787 RepID=A0A8I2Z6Z2_VERLO|nr:hypothetical protein HYQ45_017136 [Verticillium longisporum]